METKHCKRCKSDKDSTAFMIGDKCYKQCGECVKKTWCSHNRIKSQCKDCGGSRICSHNRMKSQCKDCGGSRVCIHNRMKSMCKDCGGSSICSHNRVKSSCKDCGGISICIHNRRKSTCKDCGGVSICSHNRMKTSCKDCGGGSICSHNRVKSRCKDCGGGSICSHNKIKSQCYECNPTSNTFCISSHCSMIPHNNKIHDGFCTNCFKNIFPNDPRTLEIRSKSKELLVKQFLSENHNGFIHDKVLETIHCDCSHRRRIDFRILINNTLLCVEVDENQHSSYTNDIIRYNDLYMTFSGKFVFIRFNPDNYRIDGVLKKTQIKTRLNALSKEINKHITRIQNEENTELLEIHKLYYNQ